jgi:hypothetical protein
MSLCAAAGVVTLGFTWKWEAQPVVKASSLPFMTMIAGGIIMLFVYGSITNANVGESPSEGVCFASEFVKGTAFVLLFGSLLVKSYRLHKIFNSTKLRVVKVSNSDLFRAVSVLLAIDWLISALSISVGEPALERVTYGTQQVFECTYKHGSVWTGLHQASRALLMAVVVGMCYKNRNVPSLFNETKSIAFVSYNAAFFFILESVLRPLINGNPSAQTAITNFSVLTIGWVSLALLFFTKFYVIFFDAEANTFGSAVSGTTNRTGTVSHGTVSVSDTGGAGNFQSKRPSMVATNSTAGTSSRPTTGVEMPKLGALPLRPLQPLSALPNASASEAPASPVSDPGSPSGVEMLQVKPSDEPDVPLNTESN